MRKSRITLALWLVLSPVLSSVLMPQKLQGQAATFPAQPQVTVVLQLTANATVGNWVDLSQALGDNGINDVHYWTLTWKAFTSFGTIPTCEVKAQQATDKSSPSDLITDQLCTVNGTVAASVGAETNFVRINLDTKSGTGKVFAILDGYRQDPFGSLGLSITPGSGPIKIEDTNGNPILNTDIVSTYSIGGASGTPAQVSITNSATLLAASRSPRILICFENYGVTDVYLGVTSGVTTSTGFLLPGIKGANMCLPSTASWYGITTSATVTVGVTEVY